MDQKKIGNFLRELRKEKGLTQEQVAVKFNTTNRTVSRWETGFNMPDISLLVEISEFYGVDVRELIDGERKTDNMDKEVKEVAEKMADYAGHEKLGMLKFIRGISIACVGLSGLLLAFQLIGMIISKSPDILMIAAMVLLFVFSSIIAFYTNGKLKKMTAKTVATTSLKIATIFAICVVSALLLIGLFIFAIYASFHLNPFMVYKKKGIDKYDKTFVLEKYRGDLNSFLYIFPDDTSKMIDPEYEARFEYGLFDTDGYMILKTTYSPSDYEAEKARLAAINCSVEYEGEVHYNEVQYNTTDYRLPAYIAVDGYNSVYEYALINDATYEIVYVYTSFWTDIDEAYKKDSYPDTVGSTLSRFNIYYYYDSANAIAVSADEPY